MRVTVVGSGLFGLTVANLVAAKSAVEVKILERRSHIGGNAWSEFDAGTGVEYHKYGTHIFHTSNRKVINYVKQFTDFTSYEHRVWSRYDGQVFSLPINLLTLSQVYGRSFTPNQARDLFARYREIWANPTNLEEKALSLVGPDLYETLIKGYTIKQWQRDPRELPPEIITRLPVRLSYDNRYFSDTFQGLPVDGYAAWLTRMTEHPLIEIHTGQEFTRATYMRTHDEIIVYTGPIDEYFGYQHGSLHWRTIDLSFETIDELDYQGCPVMNYAEASDARTRTHEFRHLHPERPSSSYTLVAHEYSRDAQPGDEPYYPINTVADRDRLHLYRQLADAEEGTYFGGRLATFQYLDMHMAIASAISLYDNHLASLLDSGT